MITQPSRWKFALENLRNSPYALNRAPQKSGDALLVLLSKGFAGLIDPKGDFVQALVRKSFWSYAPNTVHVYLAVVDRIPATAEFMRKLQDARPIESNQSKLDNTCEGWSMVLLNNQSLKFTPRSPADNAENVPHIAFSATGRKSVVSTVRIPLTNTLFENGQHHTLIATEWQKAVTGHQKEEPEERVLQLESVTALQSMAVNIDLDMHATEAVLDIPHERLTHVRRIEESLGNVVRALSKLHYRHFGEQVDAEISNVPQDNFVSASAELQQNLNSLHGMKDKRQIFAAIGPLQALEELDREEERRHERNIAKGKKTAPQIATLMRQHTIKYLRMGLDIRRVVGGGGEWGDRAALITLQPDALFDQKKSVDFDTVDLESDSFSQHLRSTSVAPEGSYMQFFAANHVTARAAPPQWTAEVQIGCRSSDIVGAQDNTTPYHHELVQGLFGGITTQGLGISSCRALQSPEPEDKENDRKDTSTIDIPGATFVWRLTSVRRKSRIIKNAAPDSLGGRLRKHLTEDGLPSHPHYY